MLTVEELVLDLARLERLQHVNYFLNNKIRARVHIQLQDGRYTLIPGMNANVRSLNDGKRGHAAITLHCAILGARAEHTLHLDAVDESLHPLRHGSAGEEAGEEACRHRWIGDLSTYNHVLMANIRRHRKSQIRKH